MRTQEKDASSAENIPTGVSTRLGHGLGVVVWRVLAVPVPHRLSLPGLLFFFFFVVFNLFILPAVCFTRSLPRRPGLISQLDRVPILSGEIWASAICYQRQFTLFTYVRTYFYFFINMRNEPVPVPVATTI